MLIIVTSVPLAFRIQISGWNKSDLSKRHI